MPAPTFKCVICSATVSRPQSVAYQTGRACRLHPEAMVEFNKREAERLQHNKQNVTQHEAPPPST